MRVRLWEPHGRWRGGRHIEPPPINNALPWLRDFLRNHPHGPSTGPQVAGCAGAVCAVGKVPELLYCLRFRMVGWWPVPTLSIERCQMSDELPYGHSDIDPDAANEEPHEIDACYAYEGMKSLARVLSCSCGFSASDSTWEEVGAAMDEHLEGLPK